MIVVDQLPTVEGLRLRQAYADAAGQGTVVWRMGPHAQAAATEIQSLFAKMEQHGQTTNTDAVIAKN